MLKIKKSGDLKPFLVAVHGESGVGKTTFASEFEKPLFICTESGLGQIATDFIEIENYSEFIELLNGDYFKEYKTIVIDSLDWLESLIYKNMMQKYNVDTVTKCGGGYGAYIGIALSEWQKIIKALNVCRNKQGKNIVLICHSQVKPFHDPTHVEPYDKYKLKLQDRVSALITEWVDVLLFAKFETFVRSAENAMKKNKAIATGKRVAYPYGQASFDAKTRFKMPGNFEFNYKNFIEALGSAKFDLEAYIGELMASADGLEDELRERIFDVIDQNKNNLEALKTIETRIKALKEEK